MVLLETHSVKADYSFVLEDLQQKDQHFLQNNNFSKNQLMY